MADEPILLNLKVLSPSTEVEGDISLPETPATTTVRDLRALIQDAIRTRPATDRMRLIYRGRVVAKETDTLIDVFGLDNVRSSKDQSLHLVLRELPPATSPAPSPAPRSATAPPNPFRPDGAVPASPQQTNPFRTAPQPRPNSQPQLPHPHHHHHHHHHHHAQPPQNPLATLPIPPELRQHLASTLAQNNAQPPTQDQQSGASSSAPADTNQALPQAARPSAFPPSATRTIRHEGIGPNGERWTVTFNNTISAVPAHPQPLLPRPFPHPPGFPLPLRQQGVPSSDAVDQMLPRIRLGLQGARQEMDNVRTLLQAPGGQPVSASTLASLNPPSWRVDRIRQHVRILTQNLDQVERGLASIVADPAMADNRDVASLQHSANELRGHAEELNRMLDRMRDSDSSDQTSSGQATSSGSAPSTSSGAESHAAASQTLPPLGSQQTLSEPPTELFILSSPQGPVGILFNQGGTYTTAPMVSTLPFQAFTQQFSANRQLIAGLGQQIAQNTNLHNHLAAGQAARAQQPAGGMPAAAHPDQNQNQNQNGNANANANQNQNANPVADNDRLPWAANIWRVFQLACFVWIFAGSGSWYRPLLMAAIGLAIHLAQTGMFEAQFRMIQRHFEALLPLADRPARQNANPNEQAQAQDQQGRAAGDFTPEEAARRLVRQHQEHRFGWIRDTMRGTERAFAIFVASLWPGVGERMVEAVEERARAERAAEEERQRQEEARRQEAEQARQNQEKPDEEKVEEKAEKAEKAESAGNVETKPDDTKEAPQAEEQHSKDKGKARVEDAADEESNDWGWGNIDSAEGEGAS